MTNKIYISNLSFSLRDADLEKVFAEYGKVTSAKVIMDRFSGRSKGFGFVEMSTDEETQKSIEALNGTMVNGREVRVMISVPKPETKTNNSSD
jgi:RNA recognition motif-containing protein